MFKEVYLVWLIFSSQSNFDQFSSSFSLTFVSTWPRAEAGDKYIKDLIWKKKEKKKFKSHFYFHVVSILMYFESDFKVTLMQV